MADITLTYKGNTIAELSESGNKTIETAGKYCEADILLEYEKQSIFKVKQTVLTEEKTSVGILNQLEAKFFYNKSFVYLVMFSNSSATQGSSYTNNNFYMLHEGTNILEQHFSQKPNKVSPSSFAYNMKINQLYEGDLPTISADGSFQWRRPAETVHFPIGTICQLIEVPVIDFATGEYDTTPFGG